MAAPRPFQERFPKRDTSNSLRQLPAIKSA